MLEGVSCWDVFKLESGVVEIDEFAVFPLPYPRKFQK